MKRRILPDAVRDLRAIDAYISLDNRETAKAVAERFRKAFDLITSQPEIGRPTEFANVREWSVPGLPYVIPYRVCHDHIEILRV